MPQNNTYTIVLHVTYNLYIYEKVAAVRLIFDDICLYSVV